MGGRDLWAESKVNNYNIVSRFFGARLKEDHLSPLIGNFLCLPRIISHVVAFDGVVRRGKRRTRKRGGERKRKKKNYRMKLGWKTFTTAFLEKHSVQIKQVAVCEECNNRFRGTFSSFCLGSFFLYFILSVILSVQN